MSEQKRDWYLIDAKNIVLGRLAVQVAQLLRGKHKLDWAPHKDNGDFVVLVNADHVHLSGNKWANKSYYSHSRYIGSLKEKKAQHLPSELLIRKTISGMLPKNKLRNRMMKKLKIYSQSEHPHSSQNPKIYSFKGTSLND